MIYPAIGISTLVHLAIIMSVKIAGLFGFKIAKKNKNKNILNRALLSLAIALIMESALIIIIATSVAAIDVGLSQKESNFRLIKNFYFSEIVN